MSVKTDVINLQINVNSNQAQNHLNELRKKADSIRLSMDGLKKSTQEYKDKAKELAAVTSQMDELKRSIGLTALSQKELERELTKLQRLKGSVAPFSKEYKELASQIDKVNDRLYEVRNNVTGFSKIFSKVKDEVKQFGALAVAYLGFQFVSDQFKNIINGAGKTSDQLADLRRVSGLTADEVNKLNKSLSGLDTRTSTGSLRDIAIIAGKLGVAKNDVLGFTAAVDKLVVALGDELGDADQITTQLGKILNVFDGKVNGDNITKLGNAFVVMANAGVASGGYIADFTQRVAAVSKAANLGLGDVVGFAAGLEEMGLKAESSGTAFQKVLGDMANDLPKAARLAGAKTKEEIGAFINLFNNSPEQALVKFAEGLAKNKSGFAEMTASMKDAGEEGVRVITLLSTLGQNGDFFRNKLKMAGDSLKDNAAITEAFALKNENLGASLDKLGKEFNRFTNSPALKNFLIGAVDGIRNFIQALKSVPDWIKDNIYWLGLLSTGLLLMNANYIKAAFAISKNTGSRLLNTAAIKAGYAAGALDNAITVTGTAVKTIYSTVISLLTGRIALATAAQRIWTAALSLGLGPIGILITSVALLGGAIGALASGFKDSNTYASAYNETLKESAKETAKQKSEIDSLVAVIKDSNISLETRKSQLQKLIDISPEYLGRLTLENIATAEGKRILDTYNKALETNANLKAASILKDKEFENNTRLKALKQELEVAKKLGLGYGELSDDAKKAFSSFGTSVGRTAFTADLLNFDISESDWKEVFKDIDAEMGKSQTKLNAYTQNLKDRTSDVSNARRTFLLREITAFRQEMNNLEKGTEAYTKAKAKYDAAWKKYSSEFYDQNKKTTTTSPDNTSNTDDASKQAAAEAKRLREQKQKEYEQLLKDAKKFREELDKLKQKAESGNLSEKDKELELVEQQYRELTARAVKYWASTTADGKKALKDIEEIRMQQVTAIMKKYFDADSANEYSESLKNSEAFFDDLRRQEGASYATGKINKVEYEKSLSDIEERETANRVQIATDYKDTVQKAAADLTVFLAAQGDKRVKKAISDAEKTKAATEAEMLAGLRLAVATAPNGSKKQLDAKKDLLKKQFELDTEYLDKRSNAYKLKEELLNNDLEQLAVDSFKAKIDAMLQIADYFGQALSAVNTLISNKENNSLQKDKKNNDIRRNQYKQQLDSKLISQERYDKKIAKLEADQEKRQKEIARKQAKREKALSIYSAILSTAQAIAGQLAMKPVGPWNIALAAVMGLLGGIQVAAIASAPLPELGTGGLLQRGPKHRDSQKGLHVVNPLTGKTEMLLERDEAVIAARAMNSSRQMTVSGTPRQIASAINSAHGGVSFSAGARVKWHTSPTPSLKPSFVKMMATGGLIGSNGIKADNSLANDYSDMFFALIAEQRQMRADMASWQTNLKAHIVLSDFEAKRNLMDRARATGAIKKG
ncbi:MAG: phage tail tape measure protein [Sphingobacteriales bacterium 39-19]|nr:phage tail tape measure protein [Sphingobacteriales bacterium]OJW09949.1 MAG: phage tail tape measure protein [Sphingobacteriales bacterium 39-19]